MDDTQLTRYSRHILLPEIGIEGQERICRSRVLVVGAGGLGAPVAIYLASAGVGTITLCDGDRVDLTNLQRQVIFRGSDVGRPKVAAAADAIAALNPEVRVVAVGERVDADRLSGLVANADIVVDCSDNFPTRHAINRACVELRRPLVSGAGVRFDGQVSVFDLREATSACYSCLFPEGTEVEETRCAVMGVFAPLVGMIGTVQAAEALKLAAGIGESLNGRLLLLDGLAMEWREVRLKKDPDCPVCRTYAEPPPGSIRRSAATGC
ncbi:MAG TPA: HesA/MoeB/ThiF family protein [Burkholderiales bacterium]|nr:HesA/MoeB/ThiF family protein [Betaproteobacteria bacterium]HQR52161.1 HesA/MoeB/ThiF family protein [Burkholderiales bacterium]